MGSLRSKERRLWTSGVDQRPALPVVAATDSSHHRPARMVSPPLWPHSTKRFETLLQGLLHSKIQARLGSVKRLGAKTWGVPGAVSMLDGRSSVPAEVLEHLGPVPERIDGWGGSAVLRGRGRVAKVGPSARRNAVVLSLDLPLRRPQLLDYGADWVVMEDVPDHEAPWTPAELMTLLPDLAALHAVTVDPLIGSPLDEPLLTWSLRVGAFGNLSVPLPKALRSVLEDPTPLLQVLTAGPRVLLHTDPYRANIRRPSPGERVWIDWDDAVLGPPALDLAAWLLEGPWFLGRIIDREEARAEYGEEVDDVQLDAAVLLITLTQDLVSLRKSKGPALVGALIDERMECLARLGVDIV